MFEKCTTTKDKDWWFHPLFQCGATHLGIHDTIKKNYQCPNKSSISVSLFSLVFCPSTLQYSFESISPRDIYLGLISAEYTVVEINIEGLLKIIFGLNWKPGHCSNIFFFWSWTQQSQGYFKNQTSWSRCNITFWFYDSLECWNPLNRNSLFGLSLD